MRLVLVLALLALPGCAHRDQNLAVRKDTKPPHGEFEPAPARGRGQNAPPAPAATPPVP